MVVLVLTLLLLAAFARSYFGRMADMAGRDLGPGAVRAGGARRAARPDLPGRGVRRGSATEDTPTENIHPATGTGEPAPPDASLADVVGQLTAELGDRVDASTVSRVVLDCCHDLQGSPAAARTVGLEHLARQRLLAHTPTAP